MFNYYIYSKHQRKNRDHQAKFDHGDVRVVKPEKLRKLLYLALYLGIIGETILSEF